MSSSRSTGCPPREARGVCPSLPCSDRYHGVSVTHCAMSQCVRHKPRDITRCVRHTPPVTHHAISRGVQSYTRKMITECPPREARGVLLAKHGVSACLYHAATVITVCPSHTAQCRKVSVTNRAISRGVSVTQRVTDITRPMWCMPPLYFLQHCTNAFTISLLQLNK